MYNKIINLQYLYLKVIQQMDKQDESFYNEFIVFLYKSFQQKLFNQKLDQSNIIQYRKKNIDPLFPSKIQNQNGAYKNSKYKCGQICCDIDTGKFFCGDIIKGSEQMNIFGLGIALYFKYIKYLILFFLIATIITAVPLFMYFEVSAQNDLLTTDINSVLFSSTIGTLSASSIKCVYGNNAEYSILKPNCSIGNIKFYDLVYTNNSYVNLKNCNNQIANSNSPSYQLKNNTEYSTSCSNNKCNITIMKTSNNNYTFISAPYSCQSVTYTMFGKPVTNNQIMISIVTCDIAILLIYIAFHFFQSLSQTKEKQNFQTSQTCLKDFTIQIQKVKFQQNQSMSTSQKLSNFIKKFRQGLKDVGVVQLDILKVKVPESNTRITMRQNQKQIYLQLYNLFQKQLFQKQIIVTETMTYQQFIKLVQYPKLKQKIITLIQKFKKQSQGVSITTKSTPVFVTFQSNQEIYKIFKACNDFCFSKYIKIGGIQHKIKQAPIPDLIIWKNLKSNTKLRTLFSWIITIIILVLSYVLIAYAYSQKNVLISQYNYNIDCNLKYNNNKSYYNTWNATLATDSIWVNCYCSSNLLTINDHPQCLKWLEGFSFYNLSPIFVSMIIVIYNMIVSYIFRKLSQFQAHRHVTQQLYSYVLKRTMLLLLNTCLVIVLINLKLDVNTNLSLVSFLFGGTYADITADWYYNVGIAILFTMIFNIVMPIAQLAIQWFMNFLLQMYDKKCWTAQTSKKTKSQYFKLYCGIAFPIQQRYAQILSILFITFTYNQVIPLLNIVGLFSFVILFISDKILIFRFFRLKNYDQKLQSMITSTVLYAIIFHLIVAIFYLSEPTLDPTIINNSYSDIFGNNKRMKLIAQQVQIYPYVIIIALFVIWFIFKNTIVKLITQCLNNIKRFSYIKEHSKKLYDTLNQLQLEQLLTLNTDQFLRNQHQVDMIKLHNSAQNNQDAILQFPSIYRLAQNNKIGVATEKNMDRLDEYAKIVYIQRQKLIKQINKQEKRSKGARFLGMVDYDSKLSGENMNIYQQIINFEKKLENILTKNLSFLCKEKR